MAAIDAFIDDLYHDQRIIADGVFPAELLEQSMNFRPESVGANPAYGGWAHVCDSDLVRDGDGTMYVLEDNLRVPSGVSYVRSPTVSTGVPATWSAPRTRREFCAATPPRHRSVDERHLDVGSPACDRG